jgi:hypothetical protein
MATDFHGWRAGLVPHRLLTDQPNRGGGEALRRRLLELVPTPAATRTHGLRDTHGPGPGTLRRERRVLLKAS